MLERWTNVYYVQDILEELLKNEAVKSKLLFDSLRGCNQKTARVIDEIAGDDPKKLAQVLIEGCEAYSTKREGWILPYCMPGCNVTQWIVPIRKNSH